MDRKVEILEKMRNARSWKELQYTIQEVYEAFSTGSTAEKDELVEKINRLTETNRKLRAELKAAKKN